MVRRSSRARSYGKCPTISLPMAQRRSALTAPDIHLLFLGFGLLCVLGKQLAIVIARQFVPVIRRPQDSFTITDKQFGRMETFWGKISRNLSTIAAVVTNSLASSGLVGATPLGLLLTTGMVSVTTTDNRAHC